MCNNQIIALLDCNNFYASCERIFRPNLENKPIIVLSNNDGCIVARSNEAKKLGIKMAAPFYFYKDLIRQNNVEVFSSNYELYGDISCRVMKSIKIFALDMEIYSIDEAFFRVNDISNINDLCLNIRRKILQWVGIPTSIGIAQTKTLAKIANNIAKNNSKIGVFDFRDEELQDRILKKLAIEEIWGISQAISSKLHKIGIASAYELKLADSKQVRKILGVIGERIIYELRGVSCLELKDFVARKNITSSRSFSYKITNKDQIKEAIANYVVRAHEKLRQQQSKAKGIYVFVRSNPFSDLDQQYRNSSLRNFLSPTSDCKLLIKTALEIIDEIFLPNIKYKKAGIILFDLVEQHNYQYNLFDKMSYFRDQKNAALEDAMAKINQKNGKNSITYAIQGFKKEWSMKSDNRSPRYTTCFDELCLVY